MHFLKFDPFSGRESLLFPNTDRQTDRGREGERGLSVGGTVAGKLLAVTTCDMRHSPGLSTRDSWLYTWERGGERRAGQALTELKQKLTIEGCWLLYPTDNTESSLPGPGPRLHCQIQSRRQ